MGQRVLKLSKKHEIEILNIFILDCREKKLELKNKKEKYDKSEFRRLNQILDNGIYRYKKRINKINSNNK